MTVPSRGRPRRGIRVHHAASLTVYELYEHGELERIPVTSLPRTLLDLAANGPARRLTQAIEKAKRLGVLELDGIDLLLRRRAGDPGTVRLREALEIYRDPAFSRSRAELLFLDLVKKAGLPRPALNTFVAGHEIDAYWEAERFAVEVDGWDSHRTRAAFEAPRPRDTEVTQAALRRLGEIALEEVPGSGVPVL